VGDGVGVGVGDGVGVGVGEGDGVGVGDGTLEAVTTTLRFVWATRPSESVTVSRTLFVPASANV
jgi:hypothetical protein